MAMTDPITRYFYLRLPDRQPVGVVAMRRHFGTGGFTVAASLCSKADRWCRATGVNKALGKLDSHRTSFFWLDTRDDASICVDIEALLGLPLCRRGVDTALAGTMFARQASFMREDVE